MHLELSPVIVWIALWIVNTYSKFQVNIFNSSTDITKCQSFLHDNGAKAITIPLVFYKRSRPKNASPSTIFPATFEPQ